MHVDGGGFHIKAGGLDSTSRAPLFAAKINANLPANPATQELPTIQGVLALFDTANGRVLAVMDSTEITSLRTAAATAVAAKYLAPPTADVVICGCGEQSRHQLRALACVRSVRRIRAFDVDAERATRFTADMERELEVDASVPDDLRTAREATIWITCTSSCRWFLDREHADYCTASADAVAMSPQEVLSNARLRRRSLPTAREQAAAI